MRLMEASRERKGPLDEITLGLRGTWEQGDADKGGKSYRGRKARLARGTTLDRLVWERSADERWRPAGGSTVQVDSHYATGRERGGKKQVQRERKVALTDNRWEAIGDRSGGREKWNG